MQQLELTMNSDKKNQQGIESKRDSFPTIDDVWQKAAELSDDLRKMTEFKHPLDIRRGKVLGKEVKSSMREERESMQIKGAGRTYFMDVEKTRGGKSYLRLTESRKGDNDKFERNSINIFPEDAEEFGKAVSEMIAKLG